MTSSDMAPPSDDTNASNSLKSWPFHLPTTTTQSEATATCPTAIQQVQPFPSPTQDGITPAIAGLTSPPMLINSTCSTTTTATAAPTLKSFLPPSAFLDPASLPISNSECLFTDSLGTRSRSVSMNVDLNLGFTLDPLQGLDFMAGMDSTFSRNRTVTDSLLMTSTFGLHAGLEWNFCSHPEKCLSSFHVPQGQTCTHSTGPITPVSTDCILQPPVESTDTTNSARRLRASTTNVLLKRKDASETHQDNTEVLLKRQRGNGLCITIPTLETESDHTGTNMNHHRHDDSILSSCSSLASENSILFPTPPFEKPFPPNLFGGNQFPGSAISDSPAPTIAKCTPTCANDEQAEVINLSFRDLTCKSHSVSTPTANTHETNLAMLLPEMNLFARPSTAEDLCGSQSHRAQDLVANMHDIADEQITSRKKDKKKRKVSFSSTCLQDPPTLDTSAQNSQDVVSPNQDCFSSGFMNYVPPSLFPFFDPVLLPLNQTRNHRSEEAGISALSSHTRSATMDESLLLTKSVFFGDQDPLEIQLLKPSSVTTKQQTGYKVRRGRPRSTTVHAAITEDKSLVLESPQVVSPIKVTEKQGAASPVSLTPLSSGVETSKSFESTLQELLHCQPVPPSLNTIPSMTTTQSIPSLFMSTTESNPVFIQESLQSTPSLLFETNPATSTSQEELHQLPNLTVAATTNGNNEGTQERRESTSESHPNEPSAQPPKEKRGKRASHDNNPNITVVVVDGKRLFRCDMENCGKYFTRRYNLIAHIRCHEDERPYVCDHCPASFSRKHDLIRHKRSLHDPEKRYGPCPYCQLCFTRSDAFKRHVAIEEKRLASGGKLMKPRGRSVKPRHVQLAQGDPNATAPAAENEGSSTASK